MARSIRLDRKLFIELADSRGLVLLKQAELIASFAEEFGCAIALLCEKGDDSLLRDLYEITRQSAIERCVDAALREMNIEVV
jgi:hypothetical protein